MGMDIREHLAEIQAIVREADAPNKASADRLHPASIQELRQLVKLHGIAAIQRELDRLK